MRTPIFALPKAVLLREALDDLLRKHAATLRKAAEVRRSR
jgi:hypothetical protein